MFSQCIFIIYTHYLYKIKTLGSLAQFQNNHHQSITQELISQLIEYYFKNKSLIERFLKNLFNLFLQSSILVLVFYTCLQLKIQLEQKNIEIIKYNKQFFTHFLSSVFFLSIFIFLCQSYLILYRILLIKLCKIYFQLNLTISVYFLISVQCLISLSQKYLVGIMYFYFQALPKEILICLRQSSNFIQVLSYLHFLSISQPIISFSQKSYAGFNTFIFVPSYILFQFMSKILVTKLLATCHGCFRFKNLVKQEQMFPIMVFYIGDSESLNQTLVTIFLSYFEFFLYKGYYYKQNQLIFLSIYFYRPMVLLNQQQQSPNILSLLVDGIIDQSILTFLRPNRLLIFYVTTIKGSKLYSIFLLTPLNSENPLLVFFSQFRNIQVHIQLAVIKNPIQTVLVHVALIFKSEISFPKSSVQILLILFTNYSIKLLLKTGIFCLELDIGF